MIELLSGLWVWRAPHPDWTPDQGGPGGWEQCVTCLCCETAEALVLIDPLAPPPGTAEARSFWNSLDRLVEKRFPSVDVVLSTYWHERSTVAICERYAASPGVAVWVPKRSAPKVMVPVASIFGADDALPGGLRPFETSRFEEVVLWLPPWRTLFFGDVVLGTPDGGLRLLPSSWIARYGGIKPLVESLRPLLDLPVQTIVVAHGEPVVSMAREKLAGVIGGGGARDR